MPYPEKAIGIYECIESLRIAIQDAHGGDALHCTVMSMTVAEFISEIAATNSIRFTYTGPKD